MSGFEHSEYTMKSTWRLMGGLVIGCVVALAIAKGGFSVLRALWPDYAAAEPEKAYTLAMLFARLGIGAVCAAGAACVTTMIAADGGKAAWWLGGLFVVISLPSHLYYVWTDYPAWYHFVYLAYLVPIAGLTGRIVRGSVEGYRMQTPPPDKLPIHVNCQHSDAGTGRETPPNPATQRTGFADR
jgi:hypothetical protein